jgi:hypothetical protein
MKKLNGFMFALLISQGLMFFCSASPLLAGNAEDAAVLDIQAKCKAIDQFTSYRKVEVSPTAAAEEGNASDILAGYYDGTSLKKIATHAFGDKGVGITEYYFDQDQLIFVSWHTPSYEGKQPKEGFGQFYFKNGKLIEWMDAGGKVADEGLVKTENLYAKRELSVKGWANEARKRIEEHAKG